ncbi:MAG: hypothetical protein OHK0032_09880 [Thermodesulfovibrionales bacterium]
MLSASEEEYIAENAYIPEHLSGYVVAIALAEPYIFGDYLCYHKNGHLIFVGYPFKKPFDKKDMEGILNSAIERFKPEHVALIASEAVISQGKCYKRGSDQYYKLDLPQLHIHQKLRNMITHASRELHVEKERKLSEEHKRLISEFIKSHKLDEDAEYIFERTPRYVSSVLTSMVFSARDMEGELIAFDIADFGAKDYAFYMFNFTSQKHYTPGASDLLLYEIITASREQDKRFINLGLGINDGVRFFKKKWGGMPFLNYEFCLYQPAITKTSKIARFMSGASSGGYFKA